MGRGSVEIELAQGVGGGPHTHPESEVVSLVGDLAAKSPTGHGHVEADTTGLVDDLGSRGTDSGTITIATARFRRQYLRLALSGSERLTGAGTARVIIDGGGDQTIYLGIPQRPRFSFTVADAYFLDQMYRLAIENAMRVTLLGTARLMMSDDFGSRSRIVLAGQGGP